LKKDSLKKANDGFTLIEVMISIVIVSLILIISTNILESSVTSRNQTLNLLDDVKEFNLVSNTLRRDFRQALNIPMRDTFGLPMNATFYSADQSDSLIFTTMINHSNAQTTKLRRVEYLVINDTLIRRQYYSVNPYLEEDYFEAKLIRDIESLSFRFSDGNQWFSQWPKDEITSKKMPHLIELKLIINDQNIEWLIAPRNKYAYQY